MLKAFFKIFGWFGRVNVRLDSLEKGVKRLEKSVKELRTDLKEVASELREDIKNILEKLPSPLAQGKSPVQLTELGEKISKDINASAWAKDHAQNLVEDSKEKEEFERLSS